MKKIILLSLSLLMAFGAMQSAFGMDGESQAFKKAKEKAQSAGVWAGLIGGSISALGILGLLNSHKDTFSGVMAFTAGSMVSSYVFKAFKHNAYSEIRNNNHLTPAEKQEAKKSFHTRDFRAHVLAASTVVASGPAAAGAVSQPSMLAVFPLTLGSMFIWKTFTYKVVRAGNKKPAQQPVG